MTKTLPATDRTRVRRKAVRATYDRACIYEILDEALIASVAICIGGQPHVQPMIHVRVGDEIILHGHGTNRLLTALAEGAEACINTTLVDALVLARTIEEHSFHYRSATIYGRAIEVHDPGEKLALMEQVFASLVRSARFRALPPLDLNYLKGTKVLRLPISEAVAKVNSAPVAEDGPDGIWSGILPLAITAGPAQPDARTLAEGVPDDAAIAGYRRANAR